MGYRTRAEPLSEERGALQVVRRLDRARPGAGGDAPEWDELPSGSTVHVSDDLRIVVSVSTETEIPHVLVEAPIPAGAEVFEDDQDYDWDDAWYHQREVRDDRVSVAVEALYFGTQEFRFRLRPTHPGAYHVMPARAFAMYAPDLRGASGEFILKVTHRE